MFFSHSSISDLFSKSLDTYSNTRISNYINPLSTKIIDTTDITLFKVIKYNCYLETLTKNKNLIITVYNKNADYCVYSISGYLKIGISIYQQDSSIFLTILNKENEILNFIAEKKF